jgi:hypothetical protein
VWEQCGRLPDLGGVEAHIQYHPHCYGHVEVLFPEVMGMDSIKQADLVRAFGVFAGGL